MVFLSLVRDEKIFPRAKNQLQESLQLELVSNTYLEELRNPGGRNAEEALDENQPPKTRLRRGYLFLDFWKSS